MTPRDAARLYLPDLDRSFDRWKALCGPGVRLEQLVGPGFSWGRDPTEGWPRVCATDIAREAWQGGRYRG